MIVIYSALGASLKGIIRCYCHLSISSSPPKGRCLYFYDVLVKFRILSDRSELLRRPYLVISGAFSLSFVTYTSSVVLPFVAAALVVYLYLAIVLFRSTVSIPSSIEVSHNDGGDGVGIDRPSTALIDKTSAVFGSI